MASNFDGYVGKNKKGQVVVGRSTREDRARGMQEGYDRDYEGMRTAHETYKRKGEPSSKETSRRLGNADEKTAEAVQRAGNESDQERRRELNRAAAAGEKRLTTDDKRY